MGSFKTRHQKPASETRGRNGASVAEFPTRRPSRICELPRYRVVLGDLGRFAGRDRTGWLSEKIRTQESVREPCNFRSMIGWNHRSLLEWMKS